MVDESLRMFELCGRLVINAIRNENSDREVLVVIDCPRNLRLEKTIQRVANVSRADFREFISLAS